MRILTIQGQPENSLRKAYRPCAGKNHSLQFRMTLPDLPDFITSNAC